MFKYNGKLLSEVHYIFYFARVWQKRLVRIIYWLINDNKYATKTLEINLPYRYAKHSSKLIRNYSDDPRDKEWQINKVTNLNIAILRINRVLILPSQTFSFCKLVGRPTKKKGYIEGMELSRGKARSGIGGGLCQLSNLLNWLAWHTPLKIVERSIHSFDPFPDSNRALPFGSGAAIFWNYVDLQIFNPTDKVFQIVLWTDDNSLKGELRCSARPKFKYSVCEKNPYFTCKNDDWYRSNEIWRKVFERGQNQAVEKFLYEEHLASNFSKVCYKPDLNKYEVK